ncbi:MAG TPA: chorismate mutase [Catalimonadaceae bacterium]|nr:chorismate mutase [Catalimonadaceae bacterium]HPI10253.1 chorismate mutase [Catalimonadaceae bacterium]
MKEARTKTQPVVDFSQLKDPFLIAGPCSAETEEQVLETARELAKNPAIKAYRAGIWKPRTRPNAFEGHGGPALEWLTKVKEETGLPVTTEVANAAHTEEALKAGVDILWIGARTTVNPFSVQEIADVLKGVDIPVMVKNPVTPDLQLWFGAFERLQNVGLTNLAAIHRGFTSFGKSQYRNAPEWSIPIDFKRQMPGIPIICDPSHIAGNRVLLFHVAQTALDLDYAGLMIETHPRPDEAWSDAKQQITPGDLASLLASLRYSRQVIEAQTGVEDKLEVLRSQIDKIDRKVLEVLAERMQVVKEIGSYKKEKGLTVLQISRWSDIFDNRIKNGASLGLTEEMIRSLFELIHLESISLQEKILRGDRID